MSRLPSFALLGACLLPAVASAGAGTGAVSAYVNIPGITATGGASSVNIGQFLTVDASTGAVSVKNAAGTAEARALGIFTFEVAGADAPQVFDRNTGSWVAPIGTTVIRWDSYARESGVFDTTSPLIGDSVSSFEFAISANVDPFMTYGISIKNAAATTSNYSFVVNETLSPTLTGGYKAYSDISGSLTNGQGNSPINLGATSGATVQKVFLNDSSYLTSDNAGVDVGLAQLSPNAPAGSSVYSGNGLQNVTAFGNSGSSIYDSWEFRVNFSLSGGRDVATLSGYAEITPIPEPQTYALLAAGLLGVGMMLRRNSQR